MPLNANQPQHWRHPLHLGDTPSQKGSPQGCRISSERWVGGVTVSRRADIFPLIIPWAGKDLSISLRVGGSRAHEGQRRETTLGRRGKDRKDAGHASEAVQKRGQTSMP